MSYFSGEYKIGERVGALSSFNPDTEILDFFGYGTIENEHHITLCGESPDGEEDEDIGIPLIKLDNGGYVEGCECWWQAEAEMMLYITNLQEEFSNLKIEIINIEQFRKEMDDD